MNFRPKITGPKERFSEFLPWAQWRVPEISDQSQLVALSGQSQPAEDSWKLLMEWVYRKLGEDESKGKNRGQRQLLRAPHMSLNDQTHLENKGVSPTNAIPGLRYHRTCATFPELLADWVVLMANEKSQVPLTKWDLHKKASGSSQTSQGTSELGLRDIFLPVFCYVAHVFWSKAAWLSTQVRLCQGSKMRNKGWRQRESDEKRLPDPLNWSRELMSAREACLWVGLSHQQAQISQPQSSAPYVRLLKGRETEVEKKERLGLSLCGRISIYCKGAFYHPHVQMAKMPYRGRWGVGAIGAEMTPQSIGKLGCVVF